MNFFVSYAQNYEDVLLWRALGHVPKGFYIDVGANDPVEHSVSKAFYERGWHGINIEPQPAFAAAFAEQRPRDINLTVAAGAAEGDITLYEVPEIHGWTTTVEAVAREHEAGGHATRAITVPQRTLAAICAEHVKGEIHFLKIDVEGFEKEVLQGMDFQRWRPWVLVVEATLPGQRTSNHAEWEALVTGHAYRYAWFDGLNRYYVAEEHAPLLDALSVQPNVFDAYISWHLDRAWLDARGAHADLHHTRNDLAGTEHALKEHQAQLAFALERVQFVSVQAQQAEANRSAALERAHNADVYAAALSTRNAEVEFHAHAAMQARADVEAALRAVDAELQTRNEQLQARSAELHERNLELHALHGLHALRVAELDEARQVLAETHAARTQTEAALAQAIAEAENLDLHLRLTHQSASWRVTAPLRYVMGLLRAAPMWWRSSRSEAILWMKNRNAVRRLVLPVLAHFPALDQRVSKVLNLARQQAQDAELAAQTNSLPSKAAQIPTKAPAAPASATAPMSDDTASAQTHPGNAAASAKAPAGAAELAALASQPAFQHLSGPALQVVADLQRDKAD